MPVGANPDATILPGPLRDQCDGDDEHRHFTGSPCDRAAEVLVDGAQTRLIRRRQTVAELLALELDTGATGD